MTRTFRRHSVPATLLLLVAGCTVVELNREEKSDEARVRQKEAALQAEQAQNSALQGQKEKLTTDLTERRLSLAELNQRVDEIRMASVRESTSTVEAESELRRLQLERRQTLVKLQETGAQLHAEQMNQDLSTGEKQRRIDFLKHQIDQQLELLLH